MPVCAYMCVFVYIHRDIIDLWQSEPASFGIYTLCQTVGT